MLMAKIYCAIAALSLAVAFFPLRASAMGYGQGKERDSQNCPIGAAQFQEQFADCEAYAMTPDKKRIILTFDQGYENGYTAQILDTLQEKGVTAIFFLTGDYAQKETKLVQRMIDEGHMLGNHGMKHAALPTLTPAQLEDELLSLHDYVLQNYDYEMQYFRPPCGEYDADSLDIVHSLGYRTVFWSHAYVDWKTDSQPDPEAAISNLTDAAHGGAIYLLHSVSETNAQILGELIDNLRAKGYTV